MDRGRFRLARAAGPLSFPNLPGDFRFGATVPGNNRAFAAFNGGDKNREVSGVRRSLGGPIPFHVSDAV